MERHQHQTPALMLQTLKAQPLRNKPPAFNLNSQKNRRVLNTETEQNICQLVLFRPKHVSRLHLRELSHASVMSSCLFCSSVWSPWQPRESWSSPPAKTAVTQSIDIFLIRKHIQCCWWYEWMRIRGKGFDW